MPGVELTAVRRGGTMADGVAVWLGCGVSVGGLVTEAVVLAVIVAVILGVKENVEVAVSVGENSGETVGVRVSLGVGLGPSVAVGVPSARSVATNCSEVGRGVAVNSEVGANPLPVSIEIFPSGL